MATLAIDKAIFSIVTGNATVAAIISSRMYPGAAPDSVDPETSSYLVYTFSGGEYSHGLDGRDSDCMRDVTIYGFCNSESGRIELADAVLGALDPISGPWPKTVTVEGDSVVIQECPLKDGGEEFDEPGIAREGGTVLIYPFTQTIS